MQLILPEIRADIALRLDRILAGMARNEFDAILINYNANLFYTTGRVFRGYVFINKEGKVIYFVVRPNCFKEEDGVVYIRKPEQIPAILTEAGISVTGKAGLELQWLTFTDAQRLMKLFPEAECADCSDLLREARMVKTPLEVELMRSDGIHQAEVYRRIPRLFKEEMSDIELQIEIERVLRLEGCLGFARTSGALMEINMGSVLYGDNADAPTPYDFALGGAGMDSSLPVGANGSIMKPGHTVMVDMNGDFNGYQTDMTRVWRIGEIPEKAIRAHEASRKILRELEKAAKPGFPIAEMCRIAEEIVDAADLRAEFMGHSQKAGFIGHGVGIELNESPVIMARNKGLLEENMTIALEPKFVIPGVGAVGVENTYLVTPEGLQSLTIFPEEISDLLG